MESREDHQADVSDPFSHVPLRGVRRGLCPRVAGGPVGKGATVSSVLTVRRIVFISFWVSLVTDVSLTNGFQIMAQGALGFYGEATGLCGTESVRGVQCRG